MSPPRKRGSRIWIPAFAGMTLLLFAGCASVQGPGYIGRADHPYDRKINAGYDKVTGAVFYVLKKKGWKIEEESLPSLYERDERYDNGAYRNLLIISNVKYKNLHFTATRINIFIHAIENTCEVELRFEAQTGFFKKITVVRNDRLALGLLDAIEQEANK